MFMWKYAATLPPLGFEGWMGLCYILEYFRITIQTFAFQSKLSQRLKNSQRYFKRSPFPQTSFFVLAGDCVIVWRCDSGIVV